MSELPRQPRAYQRGPWMRFVEGLRYGGGVGQWSWLVHRVTGVGILIYLVAHILDTFLVVVSPETYDNLMLFYGGVWDRTLYPPLRWLLRFGEMALFASVLFHALNGLRVISFDFWPDATTRYQKTIFWVLFVIFCVLMGLVAIWMIAELFHPATNVPPQPH